MNGTNIGSPIDDSLISRRTRQLQEAVVDIRGMTCESCVCNIQDQVGAMDGIESVRVSLADCTGVVVFDDSKCTGETIANTIDDMGFDATLVSTKNIPDMNALSTESPSCSIREALIDIQGMTCHSCVNNIQDTIGAKSGIISIQVDLQTAKGVVRFLASKWTGEAIAEAIEDMGFDTKLERVSDVLDSTPSQSSREHGDCTGKDDLIESNLSSVNLKKKDEKYRAAKSADEDAIERCSFALEGMTCTSCVVFIERNLQKIEVPNDRVEVPSVAEREAAN